ncbi:MAG: hypothetical protein ACI8QD_001002 [Cyclobacteriaceae bacterium]|jgi:uncharacterized protein YqeY
MSLKTTIEQEIKTAMLAKNKDRLRALRGIKSMIMLAETEKGQAEGISADAEMQILIKAAKQRRDSVEIYQAQNREDLAEIEIVELEIIEEFLPKQLTEEQLSAELAKIIAQSGASGMKDMGKVMGMASKALAGKADGKAISKVVKDLLA